MSWWKKLLLDVCVAFVVWAIGYLVFYAAGEERVEALAYVPMLSGIMFGCACESLSWKPGLQTVMWIVGVPLLAIGFLAQFIGRRGKGWIVVGAVSVALWWAAGVFIAFVMAAWSHWDG